VCTSGQFATYRVKTWIDLGTNILHCIINIRNNFDYDLITFILAVFLSQLIETEEFSDLSIADFMVKSTSAFEKLFEDQSQMNVSCAARLSCYRN
jgi:hypothetical protein